MGLGRKKICGELLRGWLEISWRLSLCVEVEANDAQCKCCRSYSLLEGHSLVPCAGDCKCFHSNG
ncbi:hypothetical protein RHMOL_Rhmol06G0181500 [Rhododendron molle]|uniref:Uncharacterized protein n=1 Tax=Rhododendron molle TaxID=49168 RepID=A0ACC0NDR1_RHOML|nr:hypothetical protein RHMOL_Rhmol06G0181500 [Rhododendron molle]